MMFRAFVHGLCCCWSVSLALLLTTSGCGGGPARVEAIQVNPSACAAEAIKTCDSNGDGLIDMKEAEKAPGLKAGFAKADANSDKKLSADEIAARLEANVKMKTAYVSFPVVLTMAKAPVVDANVKLVPEPFMGSTYQTRQGKTDSYGRAMLSAPMGYYRIQIEKAGPAFAKYGENTTLGAENCSGNPTPGVMIDLPAK